MGWRGTLRRQIRAARLLLLGLALATGAAGAPEARAQEGAAAWRVDCAGDGKTLECRAIQQLFNRDDKQLIALLAAGLAPDTKAPTLALQLPLGISLAEPIQLKIDNGPVERFPVQTCTPVGCIVNVPLKEPLLGRLRAGTTLKLTFGAPGKPALSVDVPLLGFGIAYDKATK
ncbi:invasion associated locus B family protein [Reyranella sp.]|uniref:invasion associated locus B family protein n=1 Tax=Reyranella sp. TaxID=1929291 RepID=UPI003BAC3209